MYAIISLCHFCEIHGPSVLMSTQPCRAAYNDDEGKRDFYGPPESLDPHVHPSVSSCEACLSMGKRVLVSSDHETHTSFVSAPLPWQNDLELLIRQACTRSLSCEVSSGKDGSVFYGEDGSISVFSIPFVVKDSMARGFHRWFSLIVLSRDRLLLLNTMPFLQKNAAVFIARLQAAATKVQEEEQQIVSPRALRLSNAASSDKNSRPLTVLTGLPTLFEQIHSWSVWLLRGAATRLKESLSPVVTMELQNSPDSVKKFTPVTPVISESDEMLFSELKSIPQRNGEDTVHSEPTVAGLHQLRDYLGSPSLESILFCLLIGHQVVVRGQPASMVTSTLRLLQGVLPPKLIRCVMNSPHYLPPSTCNMLGLEPHVAVPQPSPVVARIEILPEGTFAPVKPSVQSLQFTYHLKWGGQPPSKWPTLLIKIAKAINNPNVGESSLSLQVEALKQETLANTRLLRTLGYFNEDSQKFAGLLNALDIGPQDRVLLAFWAQA